MSVSIYIDPMVYDYRVVGGVLQLVRGSDTVRNRILVRLNTELGEWYLNVNAGVNYYGEDGIFPGKLPADHVSALIRQAILVDPDVIQINDLELTESTTTPRKFNMKVDCQVKTTDWDTTHATESIIVEI